MSLFSADDCITDQYQGSQPLVLAETAKFEENLHIVSQEFIEDDPEQNDEMFAAAEGLITMLSQGNENHNVDPRDVSVPLGTNAIKSEDKFYPSATYDDDQDLPRASQHPFYQQHYSNLQDSQESVDTELHAYGRSGYIDKDAQELHQIYGNHVLNPPIRPPRTSATSRMTRVRPKSEVDESDEESPKRKKKRAAHDFLDVTDYIWDDFGLKFPRCGLEGKPSPFKRISTMSYLALGLIDKLAQKIIERAEKEEMDAEYKARKLVSANDAFPLTLSGDGTGTNEGVGRLQNVLSYPQDALGFIRTLQLKVPMRYTAHMHLVLDPKIAKDSYNVEDVNQLVVFCDIDHKMADMDCQRINTMEIPLSNFEHTDKDGKHEFHITFPIDLRVNADNKKKRDRKVYECYQSYLAKLTSQPPASGERRVKRKLKEQEQNMTITFGIRSSFTNAGGGGPRFVEEILWRCDNFVVANVQKDLHFDGLVEKEGPSSRFQHAAAKQPFVRACDCRADEMEVAWDA